MYNAPCLHIVVMTQWLQSNCCKLICLFNNFSSQHCWPYVSGIHLWVVPVSNPTKAQHCNTLICVRSRRCGCLVTWFCYQMIAKPGNKTATPLWHDPFAWYHLIYICFYLSVSKYHQTYLKALNISNASQVYSIKCVSKINSVPLYAIYGSVLFQLPHFSCDDFDNMYTLSHYCHQIKIWIISHCLRLGHEIVPCTICPAIFFGSILHHLRQCMLLQ